MFNMSQKTPNYYEILGVKEDADAKEIKKAFRSLARKHHPDAGGDEAKFKEINEAYEVLSDENKRKEYDTYRKYGFPSGATRNGASSFNYKQNGSTYTYYTNFDGGNISWNDILDALRNQTASMNNTKTKSNVSSIFDMFNFSGNDSKQQWTQQQQVPFSSNGYETNYQQQSPYQPQQPSKGKDINLTFEEAYKGTKKKIRLKGSTKDEQQNIIELDIPSGIRDGETLIGYVQDGDKQKKIQLTVHLLESSKYSYCGDDIKMRLPITFVEAALGSKHTITTLNGDKVKLTIPKGSKSGTVLTMRGHGKQLDNGTRSNLLIELDIVVPQKLNKKQIEALKMFDEASREAAKAE